MLETIAGLALSASAPFLGYQLCRVGAFVAQRGRQGVKWWRSDRVQQRQLANIGHTCQYCNAKAFRRTGQILDGVELFMCYDCYMSALSRRVGPFRAGGQFTPIKHDRYLDWRCHCGQIATYYEWETGKRYCDHHMMLQPTFRPGAQF